MGGLEESARTTFIGLAWKSGWNTPEMARALRGARMPYTPEEWISISYFYAFFFALLYTPIAVVIAVIGHSPVFYLPLLAIPLIFFMTLMVYIRMPFMRAKSRGKRIDRKIFYATNYMASLAASGFAPLDIFRRLARNRVYGEMAAEASIVVRNTDMLGMDIITAMRDLADITPSAKLRDFLHGFISTVNSGGDIAEYLMKRLEQHTEEHRVLMKEAINTQEMLSEVFVVTAVTFPLFLAIMLTVLGITTGGQKGNALIQENFLLALLMQPLIFAAFIWMIRSNVRDME